MNDVSEEAAKRHSLPAATGAEVIEVFADSAAQAAGVRAGDVIVKVNGTPVANTGEASAAIKNAHVEISLDIIRNGTPVATQAVLDD